MFNNEEPIAFKKMYQFSEVDGFLQIAEESADMIKFVANEPSVGLHYVQQHTQNAVPNLINLKNKVFEKSHETNLQTEDLEDSITMVRSMKEYGFPIGDEMSREIKKSLAIMAKRQPKKGLINSSGFRSTSSWSPATWGRNAVHSNPGEERTSGYLSSVFHSAKQRAGNFKWTQVELKESSLPEGEKLVSHVNTTFPPVKTGDGSSSSMPEAEDEYLPSSSEVDELQEESQLDKSSSHQELLSLSEIYQEFKADKEAKLEEWLGNKGNEDRH